MAKSKKKQRSGNVEKREATTVVLAKIAKFFLLSKDQKAMKVGENVQQLVKDVGDLPPEVFELFGAKLEKKLNELAPQNTDELMERLERLATKLEHAQPASAPVAVGLAGVHNTHKLEELNGEVASLKTSTDELQALQRQMQQSIEQVQQLNGAVQQTLLETKKQTDSIQAGTTQANQKSDDLLQKLDGEMQRVTATFAQNVHGITNEITRLEKQLQANGATATQLNQQQVEQLQQVATQLAQQMTEASKQSNKHLGKMSDKFEYLDDALADVKKQVKTPLDVLQGSVQGVSKELQHLKEITAFLEQKEKESMQLVEATEDEDYVKEAADLVTVLVDRLTVGAQLYAKHRETIEAMEQGEMEKAAWEVEKEQYVGAQQELSLLKSALVARDQQIKKLAENLDKQKTIAENRVKRAPVEVFQKLAENVAIEQWPKQMQGMLVEENIEPLEGYTAGTILTVTGEQLAELGKYVELATSNNGQIRLVTSCYVQKDLKTVIQKAMSKTI